MVNLPSGSRVATWTLPAASDRKHQTPIIFLHGGPGLYVEDRRLEEGAVFRQLGFATIYFDQAGGGRSDRLPVAEYSFARAVADLESLRVSLGQDRVILWGNSYGAALAAVYAQQFPGRVAALILTSPGMFPGLDARRDYSVTARDKVEYSPAIRDAMGRIDRSAPEAEKQISQVAAGQLFDQIVSEELLDGVVCKGASIRPPVLPGGGNLYAARAISRDLKRVKLPPESATHVPTLIIRGTCDFIPASSAERYRSFFGGTLVTVQGTGHGLIEHREEVDAALRAFVETDLGALRLP
ncbi:alpha/beta hydrolase [Novosphingobium sp. PASSN1]|uniref:alpha/beta fold hydrolase n=1 Tax=Novosphingobium sp. PASSN1 TaxID=2015561 RepID=UPI0025DDECAE|nr:alpha/beta hydrolase [Novosphingobium sp. PASSN1]